MKTESEWKTLAVETIRKQGGYGRRFEDQYAVGIPDTMLVPENGPVFMAEFKIIRGSGFGATARQFIELKRVEGMHLDFLVPMVIGIADDIFYLHRAAMECSAYTALASGRVAELTRLLHDFKFRLGR